MLSVSRLMFPQAVSDAIRFHQKQWAILCTLAESYLQGHDKCLHHFCFRNFSKVKGPHQTRLQVQWGTVGKEAPLAQTSSNRGQSL